MTSTVQRSDNVLIVYPGATGKSILKAFPSQADALAWMRDAYEDVQDTRIDNDDDLYKMMALWYGTTFMNIETAIRDPGFVSSQWDDESRWALQNNDFSRLDSQTRWEAIGQQEDGSGEE